MLLELNVMLFPSFLISQLSLGEYLDYAALGFHPHGMLTGLLYFLKD